MYQNLNPIFAVDWRHCGGMEDWLRTGVLRNGTIINNYWRNIFH